MATIRKITKARILQMITMVIQNKEKIQLNKLKMHLYDISFWCISFALFSLAH